MNFLAHNILNLLDLFRPKIFKYTLGFLKIIYFFNFFNLNNQFSVNRFSDDTVIHALHTVQVTVRH
jgi:hypothetical protein